MLKKLNGRAFISDNALLIYLALITIGGHIFVSGNYGYFLDELYTIACSKNLGFAFVDIPSVAPALLALNTAVLGDSLRALHFLPSLVSGLIVIITGLMAKQLGGDRFSVVLAGLCAVFVPVWMAVGTLYTYDFLDQFFIILFFYAIILLIKSDNLKIWLLIGAIAGIGLMTKPSMVFFIAVFGVVLLLTKHRKHLVTPWPWLGGLIAIVIILPAVVWQAGNGFPIAEYWQAYSKTKAVHAKPLEFVLMQVVGMNFIIFPVWVLGIYYFLFNDEGKKYRVLGITYIILFLLLMFIGAKMYMLMPAYAMLIAGGSIVTAKYFARKGWKLIPSACLFLIAAAGLIQAPNFMPVLPVEDLIKYYNIVGSITGAKSIKLDNSKNVELQQFFYDRFEWDTLVNDVAALYNSLPQDERKDTGILTQNYGRAGAIDLLGESLGLPKATCGQLNYYFFGTGDLGKRTWIVIGESKEGLSKLFDKVELAKVVKTKYRLPHETPVFICRGPKFTVEEALRNIKKFQ